MSVLISDIRLKLYEFSTPLSQKDLFSPRHALQKATRSIRRGVVVQELFFFFSTSSLHTYFLRSL